MHTGDLATIDSEAYCVGRIKDMVIRGGENPYPREIEEFLYRHPKIEEAQVFGVADLKYGEELCVWIKVEEGSRKTTFEPFAQARSLIRRPPRYIMFVDEFPMTVTGKMQKVIMRQRTEEQLGLKAMTTA
ncbi:AMP-binding enzyme [Rhizobium sp. LjRoot258]|uniref:AMP-binding enzyme n=1 Tax=Rhizobium sp. LjRoot258 TaxID=3342299 RepID=UPI003ECD25C7